MSTEPSTGHGPPIPQEEDRPSGRGIAIVVGTAVLISVLLAIGASAVLHSRIVVSRWSPPHPAATAVGKVNQTLIGADTSTAALEGRKGRQLESYGWMSRSDGIVRIPIERAMQVIVEEGR